MHILLTDVLTCPRCGPEFGLIVLADEMDGRVVVEGRLGCANCREEFPIRGGVTDLRMGAASAPAAAAIDAEDRAFRTAALLGIGQGMGTVLALGASPKLVGELDALLPNVQVVGGDGAGDEAAGSGWLLLGDRLPFRSGSLRGVALLGGATAELVGEAARALARGARLVLDPAPSGAADLVAEHGLTVILEQDGVLVASAQAQA